MSNPKLIRPNTNFIGICHIPKCGGTTLHTALENFPSYYQGTRHHQDSYFHKKERSSFETAVIPALAKKKDLQKIGETNQIILGHFSAPALRGAGCNYILALVREPQSRIISLYSYWKRLLDRGELALWGERGTKIAQAVSLPFADFLQCKEVSRDIDNAIARMLVTSNSYDTLSRRLGTELSLKSWPCLKMIKDLRTIKKAFWTGEQENCLKDLTVLTNLNQPRSHLLVSQNVSPVTERTETLTRKAVILLNRLTTTDRQVLNILMESGRLTYKSERRLNFEFSQTCERHGFSTPSSTATDRQRPRSLD